MTKTETRVRRDFRVHVGAGTMLRPFESISGDVWVEVDGQPFPFLGWNDLVVYVALDLVVAACRILCARKKKANVSRCFFYDGPYEITIKVVDRDTWRIQLMERRGFHRRCIQAIWCNSKDVALSILEAAREVLETCDQHGWDENALRLLRSYHGDLRAVL